ncbi:alpha/beta fold hydrolase [Gordonia aichiensis]|uniref:Putative hydrolase n=1 Tax=Gordonia aichiensis NBRC 108223 TaxID=1220583 RepID=L7KGW7_9ACTN|nr:alpha/beta hydrolase [Gordonia aichiensis]GAC46948.1 putative hydrolase [Gordonia aichiensis NBRC 108223]
MIDTHFRNAPPGVGDRADGGTFVDIDGDLLWHFQGGDPMGPPTVLLHGSFSSASSWGAQLGDFADAGLRLFVPERSGHGHSPDQPGPYTFASMAQQVIAYLENVVRAPANLVGWSDGGVLALMVARRRPDLVARLVVTGSYVNRGGLLVSELFDRLGDDDEHVIACLRDSFLHDDAEADAVFDKTVAMLRVEPNFDTTDFAAVAAPTLIIAADRGIVRVEHSVDLAATLPCGRLAVLPGTHILPLESPHLFNPLVLTYLASDPPSSVEL